MSAKNITEAINQHFYYQMAKMEISGDTISIDLSEIEKNKVDCHKNEFFISFRNGVEPKACEGGEISLYREKKDFKIYKVSHTDWNIKITF